MTTATPSAPAQPAAAAEPAPTTLVAPSPGSYGIRISAHALDRIHERIAPHRAGAVAWLGRELTDAISRQGLSRSGRGWLAAAASAKDSDRRYVHCRIAGSPACLVVARDGHHYTIVTVIVDQAQRTRSGAAGTCHRPGTPRRTPTRPRHHAALISRGVPVPRGARTWPLAVGV